MSCGPIHFTYPWRRAAQIGFHRIYAECGNIPRRVQALNREQQHHPTFRLSFCRTEIGRRVHGSLYLVYGGVDGGLGGRVVDWMGTCLSSPPTSFSRWRSVLCVFFPHDHFQTAKRRCMEWWWWCSGCLVLFWIFLILFLLLFPGTRESVVLLLLQHLIDVQEGTCRYNRKSKLLLGIASIETTFLPTLEQLESLE